MLRNWVKRSRGRTNREGNLRSELTQVTWMRSSAMCSEQASERPSNRDRVATERTRVWPGLPYSGRQER